MKEVLYQNNFILLPNFIEKRRADILKNEFELFCTENKISGDDHVPESFSLNNYVSFLELLCEKTPEISSIIEEPVIPTYCYGRIYKEGGTLSNHRDRPSCEISISLHLGGDSLWDFCIESKNREYKCVSLEKGDAILYLGNRAMHYRPGEYCGESYGQVFLHYIKSKGKYFNHYFDYVTHNINEDPGDHPEPIPTKSQKLQFSYY